MISLHMYSRAIVEQYCFPYSRFFTTSLSADLSVRYAIRRRLDRGIKKKVLRAGCLAQLWPPRAANCLLPGLITSLCYSVNARRKPLCLPRLNSRLTHIYIVYTYMYMQYIHIYLYIYNYTHILFKRIVADMTQTRDCTREGEKAETTGKMLSDVVWEPRRFTSHQKNPRR